MGTRLKFYMVQHQHKGLPLFAALRAAGWTHTQYRPDVFLLDHDIGRGSETRPIIDLFAKQKSVVVLYPHSATIPWWYDGEAKIDSRVKAIFVIGEGHKRFINRILPDIPCYTTGWYFCEQKPFQKPEKVKRILFAPIHPPQKGFLRPEAMAANKRVLESLIPLAGKIQVVVRHIGVLERQGLWYSPKVIYQGAKPDGSHTDIDMADVVIAEGTFLHLAVARGKPAIGINQKVQFRPNNNREYNLKHWDEYVDEIAYPIDFDSGNVLELIDRAISGEQAEWRSSFIGNDFEPAYFIESLLNIRREYATA